MLGEAVCGARLGNPLTAGGFYAKSFCMVEDVLNEEVGSGFFVVLHPSSIEALRNFWQLAPQTYIQSEPRRHKK